MKTSNYITTAFFTFLFGGVLVLVVAAKFHQTGNNENRMYGGEKKLEPFSVIVIEQGAHFQLCTAENPHILTYNQHPDSCKFPPYSLRNDTLFVSASVTKVMNQNPDIIYCKNVTNIVAKEKAYITLQDFKINSNDTMIIKLNNAKMDVYYQDQGISNMAFVLQAQDSEINMHQAHLRTLDVKIVGSKLNIWNSSFESVSVSLKNYSVMQSPANMGKVSLEVDSTSHFNFYSAI